MKRHDMDDGPQRVAASTNQGLVAGAGPTHFKVGMDGSFRAT
jgi:hypothetical protein